MTPGSTTAVAAGFSCSQAMVIPPRGAASASAGATPARWKWPRAWNPASACWCPATRGSARPNDYRSQNEGDPMLKLVNASKKFVGGEVMTTALNDVALEIQPGEYVAVMGPSG